MKVLAPIQFADDTNLYRSAVDTLRTDDTLRVGTQFGFNARPDGRTAVAADISDNIMLLVGATGVANAFNSTGGMTGIWTNAVNAGTGDLTGIYSQPVSTGATVNSMRGGAFAVRFANATGTLTTARTIQAGTPTISAGGIVTNARGVEILAQKATGVTTAHGIYQAGTSDVNFFAGYVGMNVLVPTARLQFATATTPAEGILFGADVNLYRSAAAWLTTDTSFSSGRIIQAALSTTAGGFRQGPTGPTWLAGTGTPEGSVAAPVGSMYSRTDGGTDTAWYRKETGVGSTGWVADKAGGASIGTATGWAPATGTATRSAYATGTATVTQLAERLKALTDDLTTLGLLAP